MEHYAGLDVSLKETFVNIVDKDGVIWKTFPLSKSYLSFFNLDSSPVSSITLGGLLALQFSFGVFYFIH